MQNKPERIQKILSEYGILSRRKAEEAVAQGRVLVNGRPCQVGQPVNPKRDSVVLDGKKIEFKKDKKPIVIMLNKPRGIVTTTSDEQGRKSVMDLLGDLPQRVYPVGRLDRNSEGLLLLTNDGDLANTLTHPGGRIGKTYRVTVRSLLLEEQLIALSTGVQIEGDARPTLPANVHVLSTQPGRSVFALTIYEGRNRQIRKMCEAVGLEVARLRRTAVGPVKLGMLPPGHWRHLSPAEVIALRNATRSVAESRFPKGKL